MANYNIPPSKSGGGTGSRASQAAEFRGRKRAFAQASGSHPNAWLKQRMAKRSSGSNGG